MGIPNSERPGHPLSTNGGHDATWSVAKQGLKCFGGVMGSRPTALFKAEVGMEDEVWAKVRKLPPGPDGPPQTMKVGHRNYKAPHDGTTKGGYKSISNKRILPPDTDEKGNPID